MQFGISEFWEIGVTTLLMGSVGQLEPHQTVCVSQPQLAGFPPCFA
jgi:hypothetical protein